MKVVFVSLLHHPHHKKHSIEVTIQQALTPFNK